MRKWFLLALAALAVVAVIGTFLRLIYVVDMPWLIFKPWLHAHSHVAMLGWVFPALVVALLTQDERRAPKVFDVVMTAAQALVLGMLVSFPLQGYGDVSIACSVFHMLVTYGAVAMVWKHTCHWPRMGSRLLVRTALLLQVVSTIGIWAMGPIMGSGLAGSEWYYWSIQWFLHFQFNGWFWFAAMAIGSRWAELHGVDVRLDRLTMFLWMAGALLTFALAIAWSERYPAIFALNSVGVLLQLWAAWRTLKAMQHARLQAYVKTSPWMRLLIGLMLVAMGIKVAVQAAVAVPAVATMAFTIRNFVIGFIHLNTIGAITPLLFAHALMKGWFDERNRAVRTGLGIFIFGVIANEVLLFLQGTLFWAGTGLLPGYHWMLVGASACLAIGVFTLLLSSLIARSGPTAELEAR